MLPNGSEKFRMAPDGSFKRNWWKWGLIFAHNSSKLGFLRAEKMTFKTDNHVFTKFSEEELLDLSAENNEAAPRSV